MKKYIIISLILAFWCNCIINAGDNVWRKTLEQKYSDSGIEGDDPVLNIETYYCYDADNNLVIEMVPENGLRISYNYDAGRCTQKVKMKFDDFENVWYGINMEEYTYYEDGKLKTIAVRSYNMDGQLQEAVVHTVYTYDDSGNLVREEAKNISSGVVKTYTDYIYENGRKVSAKSYTVSGSNTSLAEEKNYSYNADGTLSEMLTKAFQFTVDPEKLSDKEKEVYIYVNGLLAEMIVYVPKRSDHTVWNFSKKYVYKVDPASKLITSFTYANASNNMQTGEFLSWKQLTRTDYCYSAGLGADKTPDGFMSRIKSKSIVLSWNAPESKTGLSGYRIYKDYALLATVDSGVNSYIDSQVKEGVTYDFFIQSVYNDSIQNVSSVLSIKMIPGTEPEENLWKQTLEQKYSDSGVEGDEPVLNSETYYCYNANNNLIMKITPENNERISFDFNSFDQLTRETTYNYDEDKNLWYGSTMKEYAYSENGSLKTLTEFYFGADGQPQKGLSTWYTYNDKGENVKEETKTADDKLIGYIVPVYESGLKISEKRYIVEQGQDDFLDQEITYKYNGDKTLAESITKSFQFTINPDELTNLGKATYTYNDGLLTEKITYVPKIDNNTEWTYEGKYVYRFNPENKTMLSSTYSYANLDMETGTFKSWKQVTRTDYAFSDKLGEDRTPKGLEASADGQGVHLIWNSPDNFMEGLSGYNIFKNYKLLETVPAGREVCKYDDAAVNENVVYDYLVQAVYNTNELMNITPVVSIKAVATNIGSMTNFTFVSITNKDIEIIGNDLKSVDVYTTNGTLVTSRKAETDYIKVAVINRGVYIVKVVTATDEYKQKVVVR